MPSHANYQPHPTLPPHNAPPTPTPTPHPIPQPPSPLTTTPTPTPHNTPTPPPPPPSPPPLPPRQKPRVRQQLRELHPHVPHHLQRLFPQKVAPAVFAASCGIVDASPVVISGHQCQVIGLGACR